MELGLELPEDDDNPKKDGLVTGLSFVSFGLIPVFFYLIFFLADYHQYTAQFIIISFITIITLFGLGFFQAKITKQNTLTGGLIMMGMGIIASTVAFLIGWSIEHS